ncbi:MAG: CpsB/CapC family capsule biosynthesis tyrosine phosphatase [Acidobacteriota bacterium]
MMDRKVIDIHCHILPGLDDGIETMEDAIKACRIARKDGISGLVATPHFREGFFYATPTVIMESISLLKEAIAREGIDLDIFPGSEVHITDNIPGKIKDGSIITMNMTGRYLLLELPYQQYPVEFEKVIFSLKLAGITPILSHPERVKYFNDDIRRVAQAVELGSFVQITSSSIMGHFGEEVRDFSRECAARGLVHIIASDSHDTRSRAPELMEAYHAMATIVGEEDAFRMISDNPLAIVEGKELTETFPHEQEKGSKKHAGTSFLKRFFIRS